MILFFYRAVEPDSLIALFRHVSRVNPLRDCARATGIRQRETGHTHKHMTRTTPQTTTASIRVSPFFFVSLLQLWVQAMLLFSALYLTIIVIFIKPTVWCVFKYSITHSRCPPPLFTALGPGDASLLCALPHHHRHFHRAHHCIFSFFNSRSIHTHAAVVSG